MPLDPIKEWLWQSEENNLDDAGKEIENLFNNLSGIGEILFKKISALAISLQIGRILAFTVRKEEVSVSRLFIEIPILGFFLFLNAGHTMEAVLLHFRWFIPYILKREKQMSECTGCRYLIKIQQPCTGSVIKQVQTILKHGKKPGKKCLSRLLLEVILYIPIPQLLRLPENINEYILAGFLQKEKGKDW